MRPRGFPPGDRPLAIGHRRSASRARLGEPRLRFSRTRLTDVVHRRPAACPAGLRPAPPACGLPRRFAGKRCAGPALAARRERPHAGPGPGSCAARPAGGRSPALPRAEGRSDEAAALSLSGGPRCPCGSSGTMAAAGALPAPRPLPGVNPVKGARRFRRRVSQGRRAGEGLPSSRRRLPNVPRPGAPAGALTTRRAALDAADSRSPCKGL